MIRAAEFAVEIAEPIVSAEEVVAGLDRTIVDFLQQDENVLTGALRNFCMLAGRQDLAAQCGLGD